MSDSGMSALHGVRAFLLDVDGTLVLRRRDGGIEPLPGAAEFVRALRDRSFPFRLLTNGTFELPEEQAAKLRRLGFDVADDELLNPAVVGASYLARWYPEVPVFVLAGEATAEPLRRAGLRVLGVEQADEAGAVFVDWDVELTHARLAAALRLVQGGALFFATSLTPCFASAGGQVMSIAATLAAGIGEVTGRSPTLLGKPALSALSEACCRMKTPAAAVAVVGDDVDLEVSMAWRGGARSVLVLTGVSGEAGLGASVPQDLTVPTVGHLTSLLSARSAEDGRRARR